MPDPVTAVLVLLGGVGIYYLATLMVWIGHYLPHRPRSWLRDFHLGGHHLHYPDSRHMRTASFVYGKGRNDSLVPQLPWLVGTGVVLCLLLPGVYGWVAASEVAVIALLNSYIHMHFHVERSWLLRYAWFRRARAIHDVHHDRDVNFMVADHFWDRVFGFYVPPSH